MKRYKATIVQRTYQYVMLDIDDNIEFSHEDIERMMLDEFMPDPKNSEIEVYDLEEVV